MFAKHFLIFSAQILLLVSLDVALATVLYITGTAKDDNAAEIVYSLDIDMVYKNGL